jgi:hypothetical protein
MYESEHDDDYWDDMASELDNDIALEQNNWQTQRISMEMLNINAYQLLIKTDTIVDILNELGVSKSELNAKFKMHVLKQLQLDRSAILAARQNANNDIAIAKKNLLGPDGRPFSL